MPTWSGTPVPAPALPLQRVAVAASAPTVCAEELVIPGALPSASVRFETGAAAPTRFARPRYRYGAGQEPPAG